jgi:flagellar hook-associated protein 3 FlgL
MRITNRMIVDNNVNNLTSSMARLFELQKQAATGVKYLKASDNPSNNASVITLKSALQTSEVYESTAQTTNDWMAATDFSLQQAGDVTQRAISAVMRGLSDTMGADSRATIAEEIDGLIKEAIDIANTKHLDRYIFSGFTTDVQPFTTTLANPADPTSSIVSASYKAGLSQGFQAIRRDISPGETITVNIDGKSTFEHMINTLILTRDALAANNMTALRTQAAELDDSLNEVTLATTINGSRIRDLEGTQARISQSNTEIKALLSQKAEANMAEITAELKSQENIYQTVVTISSRTQSMVNLFSSLS